LPIKEWVNKGQSRTSDERVTFLYKLADWAYCSKDLCEDSPATTCRWLTTPRSGKKKIKVHAHVMFGVLCLCAEQLMRLLL
jgi:hypothetical protein